MSPLPSRSPPPASRAGLPRGPRRHLGAGGGSRGPSARRGWGLRPGRPPRAVAAQPAPRAYPAEPARAEYAPRFRAFPPPLSSAVAAISRPRADPARALPASWGRGRPGAPTPGRLAEPRTPPPPLYARELLRGPEDANFLVCTCGSRCDLEKLAASGVTGIWGNGVILNNLQFLQTCALHRLTGEAGRCV